MKKLLFVLIGISLTLIAIAQNNTTYKSAIGIGADYGNDYTFVKGPSVKFFYNKTNAIESQLLFGIKTAVLGAEYQHYIDIKEIPNLKCYTGIGPYWMYRKTIVYYYDNLFNLKYKEINLSDFIFRPIVGLDYKFKSLPVNLSIDWRPLFKITNSTDYTIARYGFSLRYAF